MQITNRYPHSHFSILLLKAIILVSLVVALTCAGFLAYSLLPTNAVTKNVGVNVPRQNNLRDGTAARSVASDFMHAFLNHQYHRMWSLLHPQMQAIWSNEETFASYWNTRFQEYNLQGFTLGQTNSLSSWVNPETMMSYSHIERVAVSLRLALKTTFQREQVPPEDLHPSQLFQNLPFIVQQIADQGSGQETWLVLAGGPVDLEAPILPPITPVITTVRVPILMYHHISDIPSLNALDRSLTVSTSTFEQQLDYLKAQGYHTITFNQLFDALYYHGPLPTRPIILTFDDGYDDAYRSAYPILLAHGFSGMFYIITGKVGWQGQMTWQQMREMLANGMQMGSHTIHHVDMGKVFLNSQEQAQQEVQLSQAALQQNLGIVIQQFCYPSGEPFRHGNWELRQAVTQLLAANEYVGATTDPGVTGVEQQSQYPFVLLRVRVDGQELFKDFTQSLSL